MIYILSELKVLFSIFDNFICKFGFGFGIGIVFVVNVCLYSLKFNIVISPLSFPFIIMFESKFFIVEHIFLSSLFCIDDIFFFKFQFNVYVSYFDVINK